MPQRDGALLHLISKPVEAQVQMLHPPMVLRVLCNSQGRSTVQIQSRRPRDGISNLLEQIAKPEDLLTCRGCSNILCFCSRERETIPCSLLDQLIAPVPIFTT